MEGGCVVIRNATTAAAANAPTWWRFTNDGWAARAACASHRELWTEPGDDDSVTRFRVRKAVAICTGCVVRPECLEAGLESDRLTATGRAARYAKQSTPIFGGFTAQERALFVSATPCALTTGAG